MIEIKSFNLFFDYSSNSLHSKTTFKLQPIEFIRVL